MLIKRLLMINMFLSAGAIVRPPALNHTDYYNRKDWYSVILLTVVDDKYLLGWGRTSVMWGKKSKVQHHVHMHTAVYNKMTGSTYTNT